MNCKKYINIAQEMIQLNGIYPVLDHGMKYGMALENMSVESVLSSYMHDFEHGILGSDPIKIAIGFDLLGINEAFGQDDEGEDYQRMNKLVNFYRDLFKHIRKTHRDIMSFISRRAVILSYWKERFPEDVEKYNKTSQKQHLLHMVLNDLTRSLRSDDYIQQTLSKVDKYINNEDYESIKDNLMNIENALMAEQDGATNHTFYNEVLDITNVELRNIIKEYPYGNYGDNNAEVNQSLDEKIKNIPELSDFPVFVSELKDTLIKHSL